MTFALPIPSIRFKALGLHWRGNRLLAAEVPDASGRVKGVRPLGGTVEFGETARAALIREFQEELDITVEPVGSPVFIENIFTHEGTPGHEILALFTVLFPTGAFAEADRILFHEDDGTTGFAEWFPLDTLDWPDGPRLYPAGLKAYLTRD
ncbi:NUDIX hydrolase [Pseudotabrizicola alkalilacus]|uniref:NUDIX domain-containing protein n=1 Tax=Pseudotabrizicola alkalilacus TaxID=2305252 RepID=A0A411Z476_9RHOB|nr:NUDIX domain-containing protein [Pseudotabrizicola alkalilacus]RGP37864.1 NUDIX domain-containing protein [Pseudotabrizicola alkalilacus]